MRLLDGTGQRIDDHDYPVTTDELLAAYGDQELDLVDGHETLGDALGRLGQETFDHPEEVRFAVYSAVSGEAVGRQGYSDRDPVSYGEQNHQQVSF